MIDLQFAAAVAEIPVLARIPAGQPIDPDRDAGLRLAVAKFGKPGVKDVRGADLRHASIVTFRLQTMQGPRVRIMRRASDAVGTPSNESVDRECIRHEAG